MVHIFMIRDRLGSTANRKVHSKKKKNLRSTYFSFSIYYIYLIDIRTRRFSTKAVYDYYLSLVSIWRKKNNTFIFLFIVVCYSMLNNETTNSSHANYK